MGFKHYAAWLALAASISGQNLHLATKGLLQIPPSFAREGIALYPAHRPGHDPEDLSHLTPHLTRELYYSQEGHRLAIHGAKHSSLEAEFVHPTVVLDHSSHLRNIKCTNHHLEICFTPQAFDTVHGAWRYQDFILSTYHLGCGDETGGKRSFFHATHPVFNATSSCVKVASVPISEEEALNKGKITWGTYMDENNRKRAPVKGHVRVVRNTTRASPHPRVNGNNMTFFGNDTNVMDVDLNRNATAVKNFFENPNIDTSDMEGHVDPALEPDFISENGTVARRHVSRQHVYRRGFGDDIANFFKGLWNGIVSFFGSVADFFTNFVKTVFQVGSQIVEFAIVAAKLIAVPFGVPFSHSYHNDFKLHKYLTAEAGNRPPKIFGNTDGFNLASSGGIWSVQCAKCGVHADFTVDGELAFSLKDGITEGKVSLKNNDPFTIDAQFGITVEGQVDKGHTKKYKKELKKQVAAIPLSPLAIPGIITLGPQASLSVALDFVLNGKAKLLVGGSFSVSPGVAALSLVHKEENKLEGLQSKFTPVFKAEGALTATIELGLPIALEVGIDVLNGKFKKTVGLVDKPSIYASATHSVDEGHKCDRGIELRAGVKNRFYVAAFDMWDYDIRTDILYEKGIACVTADGFDTSAVEPDQSVFKKVPEKLGEDVLSGDNKSNLTDVAQTLKPPETKAGFRVIMDEDKTSILVAGEDGYIYLVKTDENYDVSAPWGTIDQKSNTVDLDVFGRIFTNRLISYYLATVMVYDVDKVPSDRKAASLSVLKTEQKDFKNYGVVLTVDPKTNGGKTNLVLWYPTFCPTPQGLRLYATQLVQDKDGNLHNASPQQVKLVDDSFNYIGIKRTSCHTVRLTSQLVNG